MVRNFISPILAPMVAIALMAASAPQATANTEAGKAAPAEADDHSYLPPAMQHQQDAQDKPKVTKHTEVSVPHSEGKKLRPRYASVRPRHYHRQFRERLVHSPFAGFQIFGILLGQ